MNFFVQLFPDGGLMFRMKIQLDSLAAKTVKGLCSLLLIVGYGFCLEFMASCTLAPTRLQKSEVILEKKTLLPQQQDLIFIDARPRLEYSMGHVPGSISLRWEDFSQTKDPYRGLLDTDYFGLARMLARRGISPEKKVIILGRGPAGQGEDGRLAWTLMTLGIFDVEIHHANEWIMSPSTEESFSAGPAASIWRPSVDESLFVSKEEFLKIVTSPRDTLKDTVFLDVRSEKEYLKKEGPAWTQKIPDIAAVNISWEHFFDSKGRVLAGASAQAWIKELRGLGLRQDREVIVLSHHGVRSAAVVFALRKMGFSKARNMSGGYYEWVGP